MSHRTRRRTPRPGTEVTFAEGLGNRGRLGNCMWQIASTVGIAHRHGLTPRFGAWDYQPVFSCPPEWFEEPGPGAVDVCELASPPLHPWAAMYLQHLPLWEPVAALVLDAFGWSAQAAVEGDTYLDQLGAASWQRPVLGVHVRRGDVLSNPAGSINVLPADYYQAGIDAALAGGCGTVVAFTDGPEWVERRLDCDVIVAGEQRPVERYGEVGPVDWLDLYGLSKCDMWVCSNSSYSVWGALLGGGLDAAAVVPSRWMGPKMTERHRVNRFYPDGWRVLRTA